MENVFVTKEENRKSVDLDEVIAEINRKTAEIVENSEDNDVCLTDSDEIADYLVSSLGEHQVSVLPTDIDIFKMMFDEIDSGRVYSSMDSVLSVCYENTVCPLSVHIEDSDIGLSPYLKQMKEPTSIDTITDINMKFESAIAWMLRDVYAAERQGRLKELVESDPSKKLIFNESDENKLSNLIPILLDFEREQKEIFLAACEALSCTEALDQTIIIHEISDGDYELLDDVNDMEDFSKYLLEYMDPDDFLEFSHIPECLRPFMHISFDYERYAEDYLILNCEKVYKTSYGFLHKF